MNPICPVCQPSQPESHIHYCPRHLEQALAEYHREVAKRPRSPKEVAVELLTASILVGVLFFLTGCATPPASPNVFVQCPGEAQPHWLTVEQFKDKAGCWMV